MSCCRKGIVLLSTGVVIAFIVFKAYDLLRSSPLPKLDENAWWGPGEPKNEDTAITAFTINISDEVLNDLQFRLETARPFTPPLEGIQHQYGFNTKLLKKVVNYWKNDYKWRQRETFLNSLPQFKTKIQGLDIHFIHVKPSVPPHVRVLPLLLLHGWPGSVREFYKIIPMLTQASTDYSFAFEVIVPSLPGYGFSQASSKEGLGTPQIAVVMKNLMKRVGHDKFYVQGGDLGAAIASNLATLFPENILGLHSNMCGSTRKISFIKILLGSFYPSLIVDKKYEYKMYPLSDTISFILEEGGYFHIQATKPDTVGVALNDSPVGLAAYILEKFSTAANLTHRHHDSGLLEKFTYDELLDNLMIYWITNSITTSVRLYSELFGKEKVGHRVLEAPIDESVPCACARFRNEIMYHPDWILKDKYTNLIHASDFDNGGHFAALEEPKLLAQDIFAAVGKMGKLKIKQL